jgi:hypothetical protein
VQRTKNILDVAEDTKKYDLALNAIREARSGYELLSKIAFALHQARASELELEQLKTGNVDAEDYSEAIKIFSTDELKLFQGLITKLETQNKAIDVISDFKAIYATDTPDVISYTENGKNALRTPKIAIRKQDLPIKRTRQPQSILETDQTRRISPQEITSTDWSINPNNRKRR